MLLGLALHTHCHMVLFSRVRSALACATGDSGNGWTVPGEQWLPHLPRTRFIYPTAPKRAITLKGATLNGWYASADRQEMAA